MPIQQVSEKRKNENSIIENQGQAPKAQDLWAAVVFLLNSAAFVVLSIFTLTSANWKLLESDNDPKSGDINIGNPFTGAGIASLIVSFVVSFLLTFIYLKLMQNHPEALVKYSFWFYFIFTGIITIFMFASGNFVFGVISLIFLGLMVWMWFGIRSQIPFLAALLSTVAKVTRKYPALLTTVIVGDFVSFIWSAFSGAAFMSFFVKFAVSRAKDGSIVVDQRNPAFIFCVVYGMFSSYWAMNVMRYLVHVVVCGLFATYYFLSDNMPSSPTLASLKRGMTTSFGSICFGALVITIVQMIRQAMDYARRNADNPAAYFILCCLQCIVSCIEGLIEFFNYYAFTQVAIYGKDYCTAAKDTWNLLKQRGLDVIINEILIDRVIAVGSFFVFIICFAIPIIIYSAAGELSSGPWGWLWAVISCVMGLFIFQNVGTVVNAGIATTFVCLAEDPEALRQSNPEFYNLLVERYPQVSVGLHA